MATTPNSSDEKPIPENDVDEVIQSEEISETADKDNPTNGGATPNTSRRGLSVLAGLVLGGVICAGIGFYASRYMVPEGWPFPGVTPQPDPIAVEQVAQDTRISGLEAQAQMLRDDLAALQADERIEFLTIQLQESETQMADLAKLLGALDERLSEVEKIPQGSGSEAAELAAAAYERELAALREMLANELERIEATGAEALVSQSNAEDTARQATFLSVMAQLDAALDSGQPFDGVLNEITAHIGIDAPGALVAAAPEGVPTLSQLQAEFPVAARAALDASIDAAVEDGQIGRFSGFLRRQLGTRSLEPREGDDPDAILSRAEAALGQGTLVSTLDELSSLPEAGLGQMAEWIERAQIRLDALEGVEALMTSVNGE